MLYKYLPSDSAIKVVEGHKLRFTPPSRLNDPFEMRPIYSPIGESPEFQDNLRNLDSDEIAEDLLEQGLSDFPIEFTDSIPKEMLREIFKPNELTVKANATLVVNNLTKTLSDLVYRELDKQVGVLCLSEDPANTVMWGNYASSHSGIVLGFNQDDAYFNSPLHEADPFRKLVRVTYSESRTEANILDFPNDPSFLFSKTRPWEYEREWRMALPLVNAEEVREVKGDILHLFAFPALALQEVLFGLRTSLEAQSRMRALLSRPEYSHVSVRNVQESEF